MLRDSHQAVPQDDHTVKDGHVWETIQTFETILELFPDDKNALESLSAAYEQSGDTVQAREMAVRLARLLASGSEWDRVLNICEKLMAVDESDPEVFELYKQAQAAHSHAPINGDKEQKHLQCYEEIGFDLQSELELAWMLLQNHLITQPLYERAIARLTELRINSADTDCLSLLIHLEENGIETEPIVDFMARESSCPYLHISSFSLRHDLIRKLPTDIFRRLAVVPLAEMGDILMMATLNPFAAEHQERLREHLQQEIHFFLTSPAEMKRVFTTNLFTATDN